MKVPTFVPLNTRYDREELFNADLAQHLELLGVGRFDEGETEAPVGTRIADIVARGDDGVLVVECQLGRADWDHWGRLEAYARLKGASAAALVAEEFEPLMVVTCKLRNEDSEAGWYLIRVRVTDENKCVFDVVAGPEVDIQTERSGVEYSECWAPIRATGLFAGNPVSEKDSFIVKSIRGVVMYLIANKNSIKIQLIWPPERAAERDQYLEKLTELDGEKHKLSKGAAINIAMMDKGTANVEGWDEIRTKLVETGERVYRIVFPAT